MRPLKHKGTDLFQKFQQELGSAIGAYITERKLREAKSLLRYTDKSLGEVSSYLCFFSQSYFHNVFKKVLWANAAGIPQWGGIA